MKTDFCSFHQKYCIDPEQRHREKIVEIKIPNKEALCVECFILHHGAPPLSITRIPGLRRSQNPVETKKRESNQHSDKFCLSRTMRGKLFVRKLIYCVTHNREVMTLWVLLPFSFKISGGCI